MSHRRFLRGLLVCAAVLAFVRPAAAETERAGKANYKQAFKFSPANLRELVFDTAVRPNWLGKSDVFWYSFRTSQGANYYLVDPKAATKKPLFDRDKLATQLAETARKPVDAATLALTRVAVDDDGAKLKFVHGDFLYEYDLKAEKLTRVGKAPPAPPESRFFPRRAGADDEDADDPDDEKKDDMKEEKKDDEKEPARPADRRWAAPDKKAVLFTKKHNLYFQEGDKEADAVQLTTDGAEDHSFAGIGRAGGDGGGFRGRGQRPASPWSEDSKAFFVTRTDQRGVQELFLVNSLATPRPTLEKYKYPMPGEDAVRKGELYVFDRDSKKLTRVKPKWKDESYSNIHWGKTSGELRFVRRDRLLRNLELCSVNPATGEVRCLLVEGFENAPVDYQPAQYLDDGGDLVWWSERTGWGHFYLYERDGKLKNAITSGQFRASRVVALDGQKRTLWFNGNGREKGENVYYEHLYRVNLDGGGLTLLDPGDGVHQSVLSPSRLYLVDNCSRTDAAPTAVLRDADGKRVLDLEKADLSRLVEAGWKLPETFTVKAADGVTDLYGNLWKPFDFDPKKKYPIIAHVYPGPQQEGVTHTFSPLSGEQQLAQLGFIVVQVGHRGGAPTRSKAYASYGYGNLRDYGLADKKAAIEQLAARHAWIDLERVGIYGHSGGGFMSAAAVLQKPYNEFFKAAVASSGNHDNNIYEESWAERYHGLREVVVKKDSAKDKAAGPDGKKEDGKKDDGDQTHFEIKVPTNAELAANLKGHLLLVHGEIDNNVHPANTLRLADALIKANKRFDLLILPGKRHGFGDYQAYFNQRMWDFFAEHLLGDRRTGADLFDKEEFKDGR
jgi:dipeptidyl aminopeptidase/acylaminoacyl peptidase